MSRSRNIKPGFFANELLLAMPYEFRLLFVGLWTIADREGRLEDRPLQIRIKLFPADSVDVEKGIAALAANGFIFRYGEGARRFIQVNNWKKHQNPHFREKQSVIPSPESLGLSTDMIEEKPEAFSLKNAEHEAKARLIPDSGFLIPDSLQDQELPPLTPPHKKPPTPAQLLPDVSAQVLSDFVQLRKQKRAPITQTAVDQLRAQAQKAGITVELALVECCLRGWQGFKADWYLRDQQNRQGAPPNGRPPIAQNFASKDYVGTPDDELPDYLRNR
jgi:hypothetical protein